MDPHPLTRRSDGLLGACSPLQLVATWLPVSSCVCPPVQAAGSQAAGVGCSLARCSPPVGDRASDSLPSPCLIDGHRQQSCASLLLLSYGRVNLIGRPGTLPFLVVEHSDPQPERFTHQHDLRAARDSCHLSRHQSRRARLRDSEVRASAAIAAPLPSTASHQDLILPLRWDSNKAKSLWRLVMINVLGLRSAPVDVLFTASGSC